MDLVGSIRCLVPSVVKGHAGGEMTPRARLILHRTALCLTAAACGCGGETRERPQVTHPAGTAPSRGAPPPLPETAFRSDTPEGAPSDAPSENGSPASPAGPPQRSRFETRRIAHADDSARAPRYTGKPVSLDLKNTDLQEAFRLIADVGKVNVVVSGEVSGTITLKLTNVPWDQALEVIARNKDLAVERDGNIFLVHARSK
jgi:Secretin and TonB N terminus short domain